MSHTEFARLRRQMSDEFERQMWQLLRNRQRCNQKFRREHPLGIYTADFYCVAAKLVIEVDGSSHLSDEAKRYDVARDLWMKSQGIRILRFTCSQVEHQTQEVLQLIDQALLEDPSPQPLSPQIGSKCVPTISDLVRICGERGANVLELMPYTTSCFIPLKSFLT